MCFSSVCVCVCVCVCVYMYVCVCVHFKIYFYIYGNIFILSRKQNILTLRAIQRGVSK